jgi:predicted ArsR family transcriptional regulator
MFDEMRRVGASHSTRRAILNILKTQGPSDSKLLASKLGLSPMAVRQHLYALRRAKLVNCKPEGRPFGRPAKVWRLLRAADRYYPDGHAGLSIRLIEAARSAFGHKQLGRLLARVEEKEVHTIALQMPRKATLKERILALVRIRTAQGYLADLKTPENGLFLLIENHCPILTAARACRELCEAEQGVFQKLLGTGCGIERTEHVLDGARRCVYRILESKK